MSGDDWLGDHLLGEQTESDAAEARRRLDEDPALRARAARLSELTGALHELSPAAWEVASEPHSAAPAPAPARAQRARVPKRRWRPVSPALTAALVIVALALGVGVGALVWSGASPNSAKPARTVALRPLPGTSASASGSAQVTSTGQLTLSVARLPAAGAGRYYEAWLMTDTRHLVPLASFEVRGSGEARMTVPLPAPVAQYRYFDVSLQSASHGTAHSGDSVLRGPTGS